MYALSRSSGVPIILASSIWGILDVLYIWFQRADLISGMQISAFTSMPIKAVDIDLLEVKQSPALGISTKNKKSAITYLLKLIDLFDVLKNWDMKVQAVLPPEGFWFAPISPTMGEIDPTVKSCWRTLLYSLSQEFE
jgi:hypothetical protein